MTIMTHIIMCAAALMLAFVILYKAKPMPTTEHFFDKDNSIAMRGFWCLLVVIVHSPVIFRNPVQDVMSCFGYIGVTFYFMTSAYGLKLSAEKKPESIKRFWRIRLPKLVIPIILSNILIYSLQLIQYGENADLSKLFYFNKWVVWLLVCYFFFWLAYRFLKIKNTHKDIVICVLVAVFSVVVNAFRVQLNTTTWCTEIFGFVWGLILSNIKVSLPQFISKRWFKCCVVTCLTSAVLGVGYLKFKPVAFFGDYLLKIVLGLAILSFILCLNTKFTLGNKINRFTGKISYEIYLLHGAFYGVAVHYLSNLDRALGIVIVLFLTIIAATAINYLSGVVKKPVEKLIAKTF